MDRKGLIRALTMDAIANDYETFAMIVAEVTAWGSERNSVIAESEILATLAELVDEGLAKCYRLSPFEVVPLCTHEDCYFLLTPSGLTALKEY